MNKKVNRPWNWCQCNEIVYKLWLILYKINIPYPPPKNNISVLFSISSEVKNSKTRIKIFVLFIALKILQI